MLQLLQMYADWYPEFMNRESMFYYGTNAVECIGYLADPVEKKGKKSEEFLGCSYD